MSVTPTVPGRMLDIRPIKAYGLDPKVPRGDSKAIAVISLIASQTCKATPTTEYSSQNTMLSSVETRVSDYVQVLASRFLTEHPAIQEKVKKMTGASIMQKGKETRRCLIKIAAAHRHVMAGQVSGKSAQDLLELTRERLWEEQCKESQKEMASDCKVKEEPLKEMPAAYTGPPGGGWWAWKILGPGGAHEGLPWMEDIIKSNKHK